MSRSVSDHLLRIALVICVFLHAPAEHGVAQVNAALEAAKQWEEIASLRYQAALGHESRADQKEMLGGDNLGEALSGAGDAKVSASGNYKVASEYWKKAAEEYAATGDLDSEKKSRYNSDLAWEAAKRTLREASEFHMRAAKQYEDANKVGEKVQALEKVASDLEALMKME